MINAETVLPVMEQLSACLCTELDDAGNPTCFCGVLPGSEVVLDHCSPCDGGRCGQAWVRMATSFPSIAFPAPDEGVNSGQCGSPLAFTLEVGVVRCAPQPDGTGTPPGEQAQLDAAVRQMEDWGAMVRAIECCSASGREYVLGVYEPVSAGDCVGGTWLVTFAAFPEEMVS